MIKVNTESMLSPVIIKRNHGTNEYEASFKGGLSIYIKAFAIVQIPFVIWALYNREQILKEYTCH